MTENSGLWLLKSEPSIYGFSDLVRDGTTNWDGVRNAQAAIYLRTMKVGDLALFYHSRIDLAAVGTVSVTREAFPDPSDPTGRFVAVEVAPKEALNRPVPLSEMRANPALAGMAMFRQFRLSVTPVTPAEWRAILVMAG